MVRENQRYRYHTTFTIDTSSLQSAINSGTINVVWEWKAIFAQPVLPILLDDIAQLWLFFDIVHAQTTSFSLGSLIWTAAEHNGGKKCFEF